MSHLSPEARRIEEYLARADFGTFRREDLRECLGIERRLFNLACRELGAAGRASVTRSQIGRLPTGELKPLRIVLPASPPSVNEMYTISRGRLVLTSEARNWKMLAAAKVREQKPKGWTPPAKLLRLELAFVGSWFTLAGDPRKSDLSNRVKIVEDSLCAGLGIDDSRVFRGVQDKIHEPDPALWRVDALIYPHAA